MDTEREGFPITAIREIKLLSMLQHENIINLREIVRSQSESPPEPYTSGCDLPHRTAPHHTAPHRTPPPTKIPHLCIPAHMVNAYKGSIYMVFDYMDHDLTGIMQRRLNKFSVAEVRPSITLSPVSWVTVSRVYSADLCVSHKGW